MVSGKRHRWVPLPLALLFSLPGPAAALQVLDDEGLSAVSGQDGVTVDFYTPNTGVTLSQVNLKQDQLNASLATTLSANTISLRAVDAAGNVLNSPSHAQLRIDVGAPGAAAEPRVSVEYDLDRSRLLVGGLNIAGDTADTCTPSPCAKLPNRTFGSFALDASGQLRLQANGGLFKGGNYQTYLRGELTDATLFYRQTYFPHAYLVMNDMTARWELNRGKLGISSDGIVQATLDTSQNNGGTAGAGTLNPSSLLNVALDFDLLFKYPELYAGTDQTTDFIITGNERPMMHFGWLGSMRNVEIVWKPGGAWTSGSTTTTGVPAGVAAIYNVNAKSQGINFSSRWDFVNYSEAYTTLGDGSKEFRWQLGEASGTGADKSRMNFELGDWARWNPAMYSHNFPLITLDVINAGAAQGVGGLCWGFYYDGPSCTGGQFVNIDPGTVSGYDSQVNRTTAKGLGLFIRDGSLMSYSRRVRLLERDAAGTLAAPREFTWGLIYTFANVDANAYIYAGGAEGTAADVANGSRNGGLTVDLLLMSQTFNPGAPATDAAARTQGFNWSNGSHLMIADTNLDGDGALGETRDAQGIGLLSSSFLVAANDMSIRLLNNMPTPDPGVAGRFNAADPYKAGLDLMSPRTRFNLSTTFGGGILPDNLGGYGTGPTVVKASLIRLNFEGMLNGRLSPSAPSSGAGSSFNPCTYGFVCNNYLGYSWAMRFMDTNDANFSENTSVYSGWSGTVAQLGDYGSYLSLAEPNRPDVDVRFSNMTGDLALTNGVIDMVPTAQDGDNKPKLRIMHTMVLGSAAAARVTDASSNRTAWQSGVAPGQEFRIDRVLLGGANLGRIVVPSATIFSSLTLKPQN